MFGSGLRTTGVHISRIVISVSSVYLHCVNTGAEMWKKPDTQTLSSLQRKAG